ncbi:MAG: hypothetical protein AAFS10_01905 [Myxococcota bacterium]
MTSLNTSISPERIEHEDLVLFINACFACNGQKEFYGSARGQEVSIGFLHQYILGNYRRLYARTLAAGINQFNQGLIAVHLLESGAEATPTQRQEEGRLIEATLQRMPPQRVYRLFRELRQRRVNNRRTRAVIRTWLKGRNLELDAVKYRNLLRSAVTHAHLKLSSEVGRFLYRGRRSHGRYQTPLFEAWRQAFYDPAAVFELPFSVAQGFAARHGIDPQTLMEQMQDKMTAGEKRRMMRAAQTHGVDLEVELGRMGLTRLALMVLAMPEDERLKRRDELNTAMRDAARRQLSRTPMRLGRVAVILDRSYSSSGSRAKRNRPLAIALALSTLFQEAADTCTVLWTPSLANPLRLTAHGATDLATPLIDALMAEPELVVLVSDGYENCPMGGAAEVVRVWRSQLDPEHRVAFVHLNPAFDADNIAPRSLGPGIATVGVRGAEDAPTMLNFSRFAVGEASLDELEDYLESCVHELLHRHLPRPTALAVAHHDAA